MDSELKEELRKLRGDLVMLRNDVLAIQYTMTKLEKKINAIADEKSKQPPLTDDGMGQIFGKNTRIEKF